MGFFKKKNGGLEIPPVAGAGASDPYAMSTGPNGMRGGGGDPYAPRNGAGGGGTSNGNRPAINYGGASKPSFGRPSPTPSPGPGGRGPPSYRSQASNGAGAPPGVGGQGGYPEDDDPNRAALLGGYVGQQQAPQERQYGYDGRENEEDFDEEEETEGIKRQIRSVKNDSLASTRNTLAMARQAVETGERTSDMLGQQSESLANTERYLDSAKLHSARADDKTEELRKLNRSIFRPAIVWNKDAKRRAQEEKLERRQLQDMEDRKLALSDVEATRKNLGGAMNSGVGSGGRQMPGAAARRAEERKRFQFDATESDDEIEEGIADDLDEIYALSQRMKGMATAMGGEVDRQNQRLVRITDKTDNVNMKVERNIHRINNIK